MLFSKELDSQIVDKLLTQISSYTEEIILHKNTKLSYQLAYDQVYQLCRSQKQEKLLQKLSLTLGRVLPEVFAQIDLKSADFLIEFAKMMQRTEQNLQKIKNSCLYLDLNYCKRDLGVNLMTKLNQIFIIEFCKSKELLECLGKCFALQHIEGLYDQIGQAVLVIKSIDKEDHYFAGHFLIHYLPIIKSHYLQQAEEEFIKCNKPGQISGFIAYATKKLEKQSAFLNRFWPENKRSLANKQFILAEVYNILVTQYKNQIYTTHQSELFNELTLKILQLFKYGQKCSDIEKHADWYNTQIKQKLESFSCQENGLFIYQICSFYKKIMGQLEITYNKFDIHYRSRFAFQEWVNSEKLQMPLRLNDYIKKYCFENFIKYGPAHPFENVQVIFILIKEKSLFQKYYRRELINRMVADQSHYSLNFQQKIVALMEKQCSEEFVKNIKPILQSYKSKANCSQQLNPCSSISTLFLSLQNWPYQQKNTPVVIHERLLKLVKKQTEQFTSVNKDKSLYWHPIIGAVKLSLFFSKNKTNPNFILNTCMANLLLYYQKCCYKPVQIKIFCCQTGYKLDQIYDSVHKLIKARVLINQDQEENDKFGLNEDFFSETETIDILSMSSANKFEVEPLQELKADRRFMVEAIIVKIMKKMKHADKGQIFKEASPIIEKKGFSFNAKFVQSAIDRLIEKEFIRDNQDGKLGYIA